ncbi:Arm DNA-binding domain-containing protein [Parapedobacter deserti]|uniref:Arm DNA-binding domain-containing protein n=1 Tax=Parapedobacter deserti TaxID=1912957 RepID=A0ABV7JHU9_9SPHI
MSTNYSLLFYLKKPKNYVGGMKPIYMRITVVGDPKEVSTGRECDPSRWNAKATVPRAPRRTYVAWMPTSTRWSERWPMPTCNS